MRGLASGGAHPREASALPYSQRLHLASKGTRALDETTCARVRGLVDATNRLAATVDIPTPTDLGYENAGPGLRHPVK